MFNPPFWLHEAGADWRQIPLFSIRFWAGSTIAAVENLLAIPALALGQHLKETLKIIDAPKRC
ncbi:MAG TPA: hypothetical protein DEQ32_03995 [Gammaproteobacteria bacterium]|nr:hypothetical protein [Gammaproteobacteria bacterium]